jgi:hypothetical protein
MLISRYAIRTAAVGLVLAAAGSPTMAEARPADGSAPTVQSSPPDPTSVPIEQTVADSGVDWSAIAVGTLGLLAVVLLALLIHAAMPMVRRAPAARTRRVRKS